MQLLSGRSEQNGKKWWEYLYLWLKKKNLYITKWDEFEQLWMCWFYFFGLQNVGKE